MYDDRPGVYTTESIAVAQALAAHLAVTIASTLEIDQRGAAMISRTVIGQAEGIVMERLQLTAGQALAHLRQESQQTNTKLITVCTTLVATRRLPRPEAVRCGWMVTSAADQPQDTRRRSPDASMRTLSLAINRASSRDTCIWLVPSSAAMSDWEHRSTKRSWISCCSATSSRAQTSVSINRVSSRSISSLVSEVATSKPRSRPASIEDAR